MVIVILAILGLAWGSFVNALVWRISELAKLQDSEVAKSRSREVAKKRKPTNSYLATSLTASDLSVLKGRSMCPNCRHTLAALDLFPLASWLILRGKCRYCHKPISIQYPLVEAFTALAFVASYLLWPLALASAASLAVFGLWLAIIIPLAALAIYDLKWGLLPNKLVLALAILALAQAIVVIASASDSLKSLAYHAIAVAIGGGLFYLIFLISSGKWIGGGDVKLGLVLGLIAATPAKAVLLLFLAALAGTLVSLPLVASHRLKRSSAIPFGPFLILATALVVLFGQAIINWYTGLFTLG